MSKKFQSTTLEEASLILKPSCGGCWLRNPGHPPNVADTCTFERIVQKRGLVVNTITVASKCIVTLQKATLNIYFAT